MKSKSLILLVGAVTLAAGAALAARALMRPPPPVTIVKEVQVAAPAPAALQKVMVSSRALQPGEFIDGKTIEWREFPVDEMRATHISGAEPEQLRKSEVDVLGASVRRPVEAGAPLTRDLLVYSGEPGFLAVVLRPGMRAVSIPTGVVASNFGLVSAGDWVDVILSTDRASIASSSEAAASTGGFSALAAQTLLRQVRVLALDRSTASLASASGKDTSNAKHTYESLTLEVTPAQAEILAVAKEVGTLQVALRDWRSEGKPEVLPAAPSVTRLNDATGVVQITQPKQVRTFQGQNMRVLTFEGRPQ